MIYWRLSLSTEYVPSERWMCRQIWRIWVKCYVCGRDAYFDRLGSERCCWLGRRDFVAQLSLTEAFMLYITTWHFSQRRWKLILRKHRRIDQRKSKLHTPHAAFRQNASKWGENPRRFSPEHNLRWIRNKTLIRMLHQCFESSAKAEKCYIRNQSAIYHTP